MEAWLGSMTALFLALGPWGLALLSFAEASFFPVPPDLVLMPLVLASPQMALWYGTVATVASTLGGLFGYWLGRRVGRALLRRVATEAQVHQIETLFRKFGAWAVIAAALTPIPYKVFTIAAGLFLIPVSTFTWASLLGRGLRFYLEAILLWLYGPSMVRFLQGPFGWVTVAVTGLLVLFYWLAQRAGWTRLALQRVQNGYARLLSSRSVQRFRALGRIGIFVAAGLALDIFFFVLFAKLAWDLAEQDLAAFDGLVTAAARSQSPALMTLLMQGISLLGGPAVVTLLGFATAYWLWRRRGDQWAALVLTIDLAGAWLLSEMLKEIFRRPRPEVHRLAEAVGYSFPSGHSMVSFAFYSFLAFLLWEAARQNRPGLTRRRLVAASGGAALLVLLIGWSRIYLGVHYPSDVLAGFAAGGLWATSCAILFTWRRG